MGLLSDIFTWWNGPTLGTKLAIWRHGVEVGRDDQGNIYYTSKPGASGEAKRWVIYDGVPEASRIPPEWHLWLHKTVSTTPAEKPLKARVWEKPWQPNATGTLQAHIPAGSLAAPVSPVRSGKYEPWSPE